MNYFLVNFQYTFKGPHSRIEFGYCTMTIVTSDVYINFNEFKDTVKEHLKIDVETVIVQNILALTKQQYECWIK